MGELRQKQQNNREVVEVGQASDNALIPMKDSPATIVECLGKCSISGHFLNVDPTRYVDDFKAQNDVIG